MGFPVLAEAGVVVGGSGEYHLGIRFVVPAEGHCLVDHIFGVIPSVPLVEGVVKGQNRRPDIFKQRGRDSLGAGFHGLLRQNTF